MHPSTLSNRICIFCAHVMSCRGMWLRHEQTDEVCSVCHDRNVDVILMPCRHAIICDNVMYFTFLLISTIHHQSIIPLIDGRLIRLIALIRSYSAWLE
jgi:hypothetical protein